MMAMSYEDQSFDLVLHSDTLEHVPEPVRGLAECRRVLKPGGFCAFTIPIIVDRLTASRAGLPPSYHGSPANPADHVVHTEYGADAWKHVLLAGFDECRICALEYPAAQALVGVRAPAEAPC
jgi:ubiquinone/menaquinone biosynthesis C-methylase UbiE